MAEYIEIEGRVAEWEPLGMSLREAAEGLMKWRGIPGPIEEATDLANLMYRV
ncbi:MAG: hypothetical protein ACREIZ_00470 [Candidatus Methylomirabilales bacterium]